MTTTTVISGGRALLGSELRIVEGATVVLEGDRILAAGSAAKLSAPPGAEEVDADGLTLMPGFIDAHVHIGFAAPGEVLSHGVTTVRDLGWPPKKIWPLVEESKASGFDGPEVLAAGQMLTVSRGYPTRAGWAPRRTGLPVRSPPEAREAVAAQAGAGACVIKVALNPLVGPVLDLETLTAVVRAAHDRSLRVTGHTYGLEELHKALDAGMDELAHMLMSPESIPAATIKRMVRRSMTIVPTLSCFFGSDQEIAVENLRSFVRAGGRVIYGTDLGNEGPRPGIDPGEVDAMSRAGMSPLEIIASATVGSARYLEFDDRGVLEAGRRADLIAVRGEPLTDALSLADVAMVWRGGRRVR
jgi:imidazolonepropionase-like amidohydrolase